MLWPKAKHSRCKDPMRLRWNRLTVFKAVSDHAERQYLGLVPRLLFGCRIDKDARKRWHVGDPAPVLLALNVDPHVVTPDVSTHLIACVSERQRLAPPVPPR